MRGVVVLSVSVERMNIRGMLGYSEGQANQR